MGVYIVWVQKVCIKYDSSVKQNVSQVSRRKSRRKALLARHSRKSTVSILSELFTFQSCVGHMLHFTGSLLASYPQKQFQSSIALSLHTLSLSHTTFTNKSHMKYRVHNIEQNYNQIWHEIKANKNIVVNYNFTLSTNKLIKLFCAPNRSLYQNCFHSILEEIIPILFSKMISFYNLIISGFVSFKGL